MISLGEYLIRPVSLALMYFAIEGVVRWIAPVVQGETIGTMPLQLVAWAHEGLLRERRRRDLGPSVEDEVQTGSGKDFQLRIASCRPKAWTRLTTVSYQNKLYELEREEMGAAPRRFIYVLRIRPEGKVIRGLHHYDPQEPLTIP